MNRSFTHALALLTIALVACAPSRVDTGPTPSVADADAPVWSVEPARPSAEMREFMSGDVVPRQFVSSGGR